MICEVVSFCLRVCLRIPYAMQRLAYAAINPYAKSFGWFYCKRSLREAFFLPFQRQWTKMRRTKRMNTRMRMRSYWPLGCFVLWLNPFAFSFSILFALFLLRARLCRRRHGQLLRPEGFAYAIAYARLTRSLRAESLIFCIGSKQLAFVVQVLTLS